MESAFQFKNPALMKLSFTVNDDFKKDSGEISLNLSISTKISKNEQKNEAFVELSISIGEVNSSCPFFIDAVEGADFRWDRSLKTEVINDLLKQNAPALLLSYLRPIISQITSSSPYGTYNIPFINFVKMNEESSN